MLKEWNPEYESNYIAVCNVGLAWLPVISLTSVASSLTRSPLSPTMNRGITSTT